MLRITIIALFLCIVFSGFGQQAEPLRADLSFASFSTPSSGAYLETWFTIDGTSVMYKKQESGRYQGGVNVLMVIYQNEEVVDFRKYSLLSPQKDDTTDVSMHFIDIQRFPLENGVYRMEVTMEDIYRAEVRSSAVFPVKIDYAADSLALSGIELVERYSRSEKETRLTRHGFELVPLTSNYYGVEKDKLIFYNEVYNTDKYFGEGAGYLLSYFIRVSETGRKLHDYVKMVRAEGESVKVLFTEMDISSLPGGQYDLVIEVRDKNNRLIADNSVSFNRQNSSVHLDLIDLAALDVSNSFVESMVEADTLKEYVNCLWPISTGNERQYVKRHLEEMTLMEMQQYMLNFWLRRSAADPQGAWFNYKEKVKMVDDAYSTFNREGYETERGRVYLCYGPPNSIVENYNEPSSYPYEIWHYYALNKQSNRKFVFYARDMLAGDFELLHSNARGELSNERWRVELHKRSGEPKNFESTDINEHYGDKSKDYFDLPR